ncbi:CP family cyanate transporter-like MFS transporter [Kushneria sinocarnis]|uniref:CP family cyanate transporter-like MFS transporter n=1 Tax=Kushneria sinocarnis TaxID=595502 RepID=A0A420X1P9_9GAMM|nr:MFS transporter [Kushneria sinocarnis]RKR07619.1 CP family cyanate transporter-like MFS transporter [Kushneria sinocarnis]
MSDAHRPPVPALLWLLAFALAAFNLRAPIVVVGPVLDPIMHTLHIEAGAASLLTTGMILCFGVFSPLAPGIAARIGLDRAIAAALVAITLGGLMRGIESFAVMIAGTLFAGLGIALGNVYMPSLVKRDRPQQLGRTMGLYTVVMGIGATLGAGTAVPLMQLAGSWSVPIWLWAGVGVITSLLWWALALRHPPAPGEGSRSRMRLLFASPVAWTLTIFMGMQSLGFYTLQTWVPSVALEAGVPRASAGAMLSVINLTTIPASYLIARLASRLSRHSLLVLGLCLLVAVGLAGLQGAPTTAPMLWAVLLGAGQGGCFSFALTMIVMRTTHSHHAAMLSGMAQSLGYLMAAGGPLVFGGLHSLTGSWQLSLSFLLVLLGVQTVAGMLIGRPRMVALTE